MNCRATRQIPPRCYGLSDTPHAVWTLLEKFDRLVWEGAKNYWSPDQPISELTPTKDDPLDRGKLEFAKLIPNDSHWHDACTVGISRRSQNG